MVGIILHVFWRLEVIACGLKGLTAQLTNRIPFDPKFILHSVMPSSQVQAVKRELVKCLLALAVVYALSGVAVNRDSLDEQVVSLYRRVIKKAHPDKGGRKEDAQKLQGLKEAWDKARKAAPQNEARGRPQTAKANNANQSVALPGEEGEAGTATTGKEYRICGTAVMLTYNGVADAAQFERFVDHVRANLRAWGVKHWCVTLETNKKGNLHIHLMLQFHKTRDSGVKAFQCEGLSPRADVCDLLGEGFCRNKYQVSVNRAMFYVWANKIGTQLDAEGKQRTAGNYGPVWADTHKSYGKPAS